MSTIFSAEELHSIVGGKLFENDWLVSGISIDSRTIQKNDLFIALKAKRDGNDFIVSAIENGAKAAIINKIPKELPKNFPFILVNNSVEALYSIAKYSRKKYKGRVIAITGSVGKTSTKDILTKMLSTFGVTHSSQKSFNNHLGVPLTLANIPKNADFVICEIGGTVGDIESLPFLEAIRQLRNELGRKRTCFIHLTLLPFVSSAKEFKTKPTQHSVKVQLLQEIRIWLSGLKVK